MPLTASNIAASTSALFRVILSGDAPATTDARKSISVQSVISLA
jgi:hypothetical protein